MPPVGWTTPAAVTRVIDGDTVEVEVRRRLRVRLLDCWAPEVRTRDPEAKAAGRASQAALGRLMEEAGGVVLLHIPVADRGEPDAVAADLAAQFSFGRVLGRIYLPDGREASAEQVAAGHAAANR